ncbi:MAG: hypothetical protein GXO96_05315 [Nitrospirae bacterium]|nr:hypothetical protein [Candidatus Manganitrophaceae bacterium]
MKCKRHLILDSFVIVSFIGLLSACFKASDEKAYEEVLGQISLKKAAVFFETYKNSEYRDPLVNQIIGWCKEETTKECYTMILKVIPKNHVRYAEISQYEKKQYDLTN